MTTPKKPDGVTRRGFLKGTSISVAASGLLKGARVGIQEASITPAAKQLKADQEHAISFTLNGKETTATVRTGHTLLEMLRDNLDLTGTKEVCDQGSCGACTVLLEGKPVNSCLTLAVEAQGLKVQTVEGLAEGSKLHAIQEAFCEHDALQCGFCTPGMLMTCKSLLDNNPSPTVDDTKEALSGNICRCGTYINIFQAVQSAAKTMKGGR